METFSVSDMMFVHLSSAVCKFKAHKRCAVRSTNNCKWTTLASIGNDIIEDEDGVRAEAYSRVAFGFVFMQIILPDVHTFGFDVFRAERLHLICFVYLFFPPGVHAPPVAGRQSARQRQMCGV